jgi:hypothetical protein
LFTVYDDLCGIFTTIKNNFKNSDILIDSIILSIKKLDQFKMLYYSERSIINDSIKTNDIQINIEQINNMLNLLIEWKKNTCECINEIKNDLDNFIYIIDTINRLKLHLIQILGNNLYINDGDNHLNEVVKSHLFKLKELSIKIHEDYYANYEYIKIEVQKNNIFVEKLLSQYDARNTMRFFAKRLIFSTNRFRNEHRISKMH